MAFRFPFVSVVPQCAKSSASRTAARRTAYRPALESLEDRTVPASLALDFSSYVGGSMFDMARDITTDSQGNVYVTGGTESDNFPTTPGAYQTVHNPGTPSDPNVPRFDVFVTKFSPTGQLIWSTFIGGPDYDRAYAIEVDSQGFVYVGGRAGAGFPVSAGAFQTSFQGSPGGGAYGSEDGFLAKLTPDGSQLVWASYFGTSDPLIIRDIDIDSSGNVYLGSGYESGTYTPAVAAAFQQGFQKTPQGGIDTVVAKVAADGSRVLWATYVGGSQNDVQTPSVRVDGVGNVFVLTSTTSTNMPTTASAFDRTFNGGSDLYVAKLSGDGGSLLYGTYLGGSGNEGLETHNLAIDAQGNAYVGTFTTSPNFPTTPGAFDRTLGGTADIIVSKLSADGSQLLAGTYIGGSGSDASQGINVDSQGNVYVSGGSGSTDFPVTPGAFQPSLGGAGDGVAIKLAADFSRLDYATYMGGSGADEYRANAVDQAGNFYLAGQTASPNFPTRNAYDSSYDANTDIMVTKFRIPATSPGTLQFNASSYSVNENGGSATITVTRTGGSSGAVSVTYASGNGTATAGSDYSAVLGTLSWADGDSASKTFSVPILDDSLVEGNETINLTLSNPTSGATLGSLITVPLTILDNDANQPPSVAVAAAASPSPVTGTSTSLSVLGADDGGEASLTYTWTTTGTPPAPVTFSATGTNASKNTSATFTKAGTYTFQVTLRDASGLTATSSVTVTVNQTLTTVTVTPASASVAANGLQQFSASARDQFGAVLTTQPTFGWSASGGTINSTGLFTAGTAPGAFTVTATSGARSGTAQVTVTSSTSSGPVILWSFDDGTGQVASDSSGNNRPGTLGISTDVQPTDPTWTTAGRINGALLFDGVNDIVRAAAPAGSGLDIDASAVSMVAWINTNSVASQQAILVRGLSDGIAQGGEGYGLWVNSNGKINLGSAGGGNFDSTAALTAGSWHQVVGIINGAGSKIYIDGMDVTPAGLSINVVASNLDLIVGAARNKANSGYVRPFNGGIDDVRVYNRALSAGEVSALYAAVPQAPTLSVATLSAATATVDFTGREYYTARQGRRGNQGVSPVFIGDPTYLGTGGTLANEAWTFTDSGVPVDSGMHWLSGQAGSKWSVTLTGDSMPRTVKFYVSITHASGSMNYTFSAGSSSTTITKTTAGRTLYELAVTFTGSITIAFGPQAGLANSEFTLGAVLVN